MRPSSIFSFDAGGLTRALWLVLSKLGIVAAITLAMLWAAYAAYLQDPTFTRAFRFFTSDHRLILEQVRRAEAGLPADLAIVGDSSCLMGIDVPLLRARHPGHAIESYCTVAYLGPAGTAEMIDKLAAHAAKPKALLIVFHPLQFQRIPSWDDFLVYMRGNAPLGADLGFPLAALDYIRFAWLSPVLYRPLQDAYGGYYGSADRFVGFARAHHGSAIDPTKGLNFPTLAAFRQQKFLTRRADEADGYSYVGSEPFEAALPRLASSIASLNVPTYFMLSPIADSRFSTRSESERNAEIASIARALGLPAQRIVASPASLPDEYFSSFTHLNRWGRVLFTEQIDTLLPVP